MHSNTMKMVLTTMLCAVPVTLRAQFNFDVDGRQVQVHSFASQGFLYSNDNNYLTDKTSNGSFSFTDFGANISTQVTDKFRVGAQVYDYNIGELGNWHLQLDWAMGDYRFKDWFGVRAGKVKTALGLFNDTQDMSFLHTWALLPQSLYPVDLRSEVIAHTGGDVYGEIPLHHEGSLSYTGYFGFRPNDPQGGVYRTHLDAGNPVHSFSGKAWGGDLRWHTPLDGLMLGGSWADQTMQLDLILVTYGNAPLDATSKPEHITAGYADYNKGKWHFNGEYRRDRNLYSYVFAGVPSGSNQSSTGWFMSAAFRVSKRLEVGTYHSRFYVDNPQSKLAAANHIFDQTVTARFDVNRWWNVKLEGHFIDGYGDTYSSHGFYASTNTAGLKPTTNLLMVRTGINF